MTEVLDICAERSRELLSRPRTSGMKVGITVLRPGQNVGQHSTGRNEEVLVFLRGRGILVADGVELEVGEGKVAYIPPNTEHDIRNTGDGLLCYIYVVAPAMGAPEGPPFPLFIFAPHTSSMPRAVLGASQSTRALGSAHLTTNFIGPRGDSPVGSEKDMCLA